MADYLFEATLEGASFTWLAEELVLLDIVETPVETETKTASLGYKPGMRRTLNRRKALSVQLVYQIRTQDVARRAEVCSLVANWAMKGGSLMINTRPGKMLNVVLDVPPALASSAKWTDEMTMTLTAYAVPYWQSESPTLYSGDTTHLDSGEDWLANVINPDGQVNTAVSATIFNKGTAPLTHIKIQCGSTSFELDGIAIQPNMPLGIYYDNDNILHIEDFFDLEGDNSLLAYRTADSSDDLIATPGKDNQIIISADAALNVTLSARGLWL